MDSPALPMDPDLPSSPPHPALDQDQLPVVSHSEDQTSPGTLKQELPVLPNGLQVHLPANGLRPRGIMKNGKPRPSAVRDYPDEIGLRKPTKEGGQAARNGDGQERSVRKEIKGSLQEAPGASKATREKKPSSTQSEILQRDNGLTKSDKPTKPLEAKRKSEADEAAKPPKAPPSRKKPVAVRDFPQAAIQNIDQEPVTPKLDGPEALGISVSPREGDKLGLAREAGVSQSPVEGDKRGPTGDAPPEDSRPNESNIKSSIGVKMPKDLKQESSPAIKTPKESKQKSSPVEKLQKGQRPSGAAQSLLKGKKVDSKGETATEQNNTQTAKRKREPLTVSKTAKKPRRSAGKAMKPPSSVSSGGNPRKAVIEALRAYDAIRRKFLQDEEIHGKQGKGRADLLAGSIMKEKGLCLYRGEKIKGSIPGVEVGDQFFFRMEISCIGMHGPIQGGIEYLTTKESEWNEPVASNIVSIVGQDGTDLGDQLIYAGQGGRSADNKQTDDQKLERGNLAMDGSKRHNVSVRVVRGIKDANTPAGKIYTYDGLYTVEECYTVKGTGGFEEYRFRLQRVPGQPELGSSLITLASELRNKDPSSRVSVIVKDIARGKESQPICVENTVDDEKGPSAFEYTTKVEYPKEIGKLQAPVGCDCKGACFASSKCACFSRHGGEFAYLNCGVLVKEKDMIFECGSLCTCSSNCRNRLTQKGLKFRLEVFKTEDRGWGVRSLDSIPAGSFVCEYTGKLITDLEYIDTLSDREHLLDLRRLPHNTTRWGDLSNIFSESPPSDTMPEVGNPQFVIDASHSGNVARFINHSCSPNLLIQKVLSDHQDVRFPQIKLFAMDNIPPFRELTFDYGRPISEESNTEEQSGDCLCGSLDCRGKLYY